MTPDDFANLNNTFYAVKKVGMQIVLMDQSTRIVRVVNEIENHHAGFSLSDFRIVANVNNFAALLASKTNVTQNPTMT